MCSSWPPSLQPRFGGAPVSPPRLHCRPLRSPLVVVAYNFYFFGHLLGGYNGEQGNVALNNLADGLPGLLFSPGFGLFIYFPITLVAVAMLVWRPRMLADPTIGAAIVAILLTIALVSARVGWTGGFSFGPRYLSEVEPLIVLLVGLGWKNVRPSIRQPLAVACFGLLLPYSIMVQAVGVYSPSAWKWTVMPGNDG